MSRHLVTTLLVTALIGVANGQPVAGVFPPLRPLAPPIPAPDGLAPLSTGAIGRLGGGEFRFQHNGLSRGVVAVSADGRTLVYPADQTPDDRLIVRRLPDGADIRESEVQMQSAPLSITLSPDGSAFATTYRNRETVITTLKTGVREWLGFPNPQLSQWVGVTFSADGRRVTASGSFEGDAGRVVVWDRDAQKLRLHAIPLHLTHLHVRLSGDGKTAASGGSLIRPGGQQFINVVQVWDVNADKERLRITSDHPVGGFDVSSDGTRLVAVTHPGLLLFDATRGDVVRVIDSNAIPYSSPVFSTDGKRVAAVAPDGSVPVWEVESGKRLTVTPAPGGVRPTIRFTGPVQGVALALNGLVIQVWEFPSGKRVTPTHVHAHPITSVAFSADGKTVYSGDRGGVLAGWDPTRPSDARVIPLPLPRKVPDIYAPGPVVIAPGGGHVVLGVPPGRGSDILVERASGRQLSETPRYPGINAAFAVFAPDGGRVCLPGGYDHNLGRHQPGGVFDSTTGKRLMSLPPGQYLRAASFSPDGMRLVTVGSDDQYDANDKRTVAVWDAITGAKRGEMSEEVGRRPPFVAVTNTGSAVLSAGLRVTVLDVPGGQVGDTLYQFDRADPLRRFVPAGPGAVAFSPDGRLLAAGVPTDRVNEHGVRLYEWPSGRQLHEFRGHRGRVTALAFSPEGKLLASGSEDTSVVVWDMAAVGKR